VSLIGFIRRPTQNWGLDSSLLVGRRLLAQMGLVAKVNEDAWIASIQHDLLSSVSRGTEEVVGRRTIQLLEKMTSIRGSSDGLMRT